MGQLSLYIHDELLPEGLTIVIKEPEDLTEGFEIGENESGEKYVVNYPVTVNDYPAIMKTKLNSRDRYPLLCQIGDVDYQVFNEDGKFTNEFIHLKRTLCKKK